MKKKDKKIKLKKKIDNQQLSGEKKSPLKVVIKVVRIIKNVVLALILLSLLCVLAITLTARMNGETPTLFGYTVYRVSSGSMVPYLEVGDIILSHECDPMTLKEGDVITYNGKSGTFAGKRVTHRVVKEPYYNEADNKYYLLTKGDNNPAEDTPITIDQVTGKMEKKIDFLKSLYDFFITPWGLLTIIGLIILAFFGEIINFFKALFGIGIEDEPREDIQEVIKRVQMEEAEKQAALLEKENKTETGANDADSSDNETDCAAEPDASETEAPSEDESSEEETAEPSEENLETEESDENRV